MPNEKNKIPDSSSSLQHFCYFTAYAVRDEVELLKMDFNDRIRRVLFNSLLSAYYPRFSPCFAQSVLMYESASLLRFSSSFSSSLRAMAKDRIAQFAYSLSPMVRQRLVAPDCVN